MEAIICGGSGGGDLMTPIYSTSETEPDNHYQFWVDPDPEDGGLKMWDEIQSKWVHVPVAYT